MPSSRAPFLVLLLTACAPETFEVVDREPGVRAPVSAACDPLDPLRCHLPWPSSAALVADPDSETGVRVEVAVDDINRFDDVGPYFNEANGFSRVTSVLTAFEGELSDAGLGGPTGGAMRLFVASPDAPNYGQEVPIRIEVDVELQRGTGLQTSVLTGDPLEILAPNTEYVVVVLDTLRNTDGEAYETPHVEEVALGLAAPASAEEARIAGYHAPSRALLEEVGIDPAQVLRMWDFVTRTEDDATAPLLSMRAQALAAFEAGDVEVVIDSVEHRPGEAAETIVMGHLTGLPTWIDAERRITRGPDGLPAVLGTGEARFRVMIPRGTGDYRTVFFGHGAGGSVEDDSFDERLAANGIAKVNVEFVGWTDGVIIDTLASVADTLLLGAQSALSPLMQSVAHAIVIDRAIPTILGDALAAPELGGMANPHAGRRPGLDGTLWVGGSLGGTVGLVITSLDDGLQFAVLNVPGAAWSQWARDSLLFDTFIAPLRNRNGGEVNVLTLAAMSQTLFDHIDGASFRSFAEADGDVFLVQESMGDPVLPNAGNEAVAIVTGAVQVGAVLSPIVGLDAEPTEVVGRSGITQFRVASEGGTFDVHGFAADQSTTAGQAAFEQIELFLESAWETGMPIVRVPSLCPGGSCDFSSGG
jgi:hypothetical protein